MLTKFIEEEDGATIVEYGFLAAWGCSSLLAITTVALLCGALLKFILS